MGVFEYEGLYDISIHAPREGGDYRNRYAYGDTNISIHAPREGGDQHRQAGTTGDGYFNPRPPRGGRRRNSLSSFGAS